MKPVKPYHSCWVEELKVSEMGKIVNSASLEEIKGTRKEVLSVFGGKRR